MFILTRKENDIESGAFASPDKEGNPVVQFFVDKDDAITYNTHLEAIGQRLQITETDTDSVDKMCSVLGYAYSIVNPGEIILPIEETTVYDYLSQSNIL